VNTLSQLGAQYEFAVEVVQGVSVRGRAVSSTAIRQIIQQGEVSLACRLLLRPYALDGDVVRGHGIGAKQTVPTLNLSTQAEVLPANGVYITRTTDVDNHRIWPSITNVGTRPTFDGDRLTVETWLLAPLEGSAPERIRVEFLRRVRQERRFESAEALKTQILRDAARANAFHRRLGQFAGPADRSLR
jgi:riboflavin kinase/FMN adenylyltransferase